MATDDAADALWAALAEERFVEVHWEQQPLVLHRPDELCDAFRALLSSHDLPALSARLRAMDVVPQVRKDGDPCEYRDICWDYLDGGSVILNKLDLAWLPIGQLCTALRKHFLHVFAVMYLTPRSSRAVPAHTDDQDVIILQLEGSKEWCIYGNPIELPYSHEQLGKQSPIDRKRLGPPLLRTTLRPGSVLYMPRGFAHEARSTDEGGSLHVTLTIQTSDLCWSTFVRDGFAELHRRHEEARLPLPLTAALGGYGGAAEAARAPTAKEAAVAAAAAASATIGAVHEGEFDGPAAAAAPHSATSAELAARVSAVDIADRQGGAAGTGGTRGGGGDCGGDAAAEEGEEGARLFERLMSATRSAQAEAFSLAMGVLREKLGHLNGAQDAALVALAEAAAAKEGGVPASVGRTGGGRGGGPPTMPPATPLRVRPSIALQVQHMTDPPPPRLPSSSSNVAAGAVRLLLHRAEDGQTAAVTLGRSFGAALSFVAAASGRSASFRPADLPGIDRFEQVALCYRLLCLGALHPA